MGPSSASAPSKLEVPRRWPGSTICCLGAGPSVTRADLARIARVPVIAINSMYRVLPSAAVLYAADAKWWNWVDGAPDFSGLKFGLDQRIRWPGVTVLRTTGALGLETDPSGLRHGGGSGYQAINLAVHLGASRIVLLGYDLQPGPTGADHFHPPHPDGTHPAYQAMRGPFSSLVEPLKALGVDIVNCSPHTALSAFRLASLHEVVSC